VALKKIPSPLYNPSAKSPSYLSPFAVIYIPFPDFFPSTKFPSYLAVFSSIFVH